MTTLKLQKRNHGLDEITFENLVAEVKLISEQDGLVFRCEFVRTVEDTYSIRNFRSVYDQIEKYCSRYVSGFEFNKSDIDGHFYEIQKRIKRYIVQIGLSHLDSTPVIDVTSEPIEETFIDDTINAPIDNPVRTRDYEPKIQPKVGLEAQIFNMVQDGINDDSTTDIIVKATKKFLDDNGIVPNRTELIIKKVDHKPVNVGVTHKSFKDILLTIQSGVNVALIGPAGSGKTTTVAKVADALDLRFYSKSMSAQTGTHEFFGYQDANGNYVRTLFREAFENGGVFLVDEFDAGNPNVLAALNQAVGNNSAAFADGMIEKNENFIVVMAGNTFGHGATSEYVGRNRIDAATLDRFAFIYFDYDEELELQIAGNADWTRKVQKIRRIVAEKRIKTIVSPRASINGSKMLAQGLSESKVMEFLIFKGLTADERKMIQVD